MTTDRTGQIFIKPARDGAVIPQPDRGMKILDEKGEWVVDNMFWRARLADGDVVESAPPKAHAAKD